MPICRRIRYLLPHALLLLDSPAGGHTFQRSAAHSATRLLDLDPAQRDGPGAEPGAGAAAHSGQGAEREAVGRGRGHAATVHSTRDGSHGFWVYLVAILVVVLMSVALALWCWRRGRPEAGAAGKAWGRPKADAASKARSSRSSQQSRSHAEHSSGSISMQRSSMTVASSEDVGHARSGHSPMPLCPLLIVPEGTRLACVVQNDVCRKRQDLSFNVRGMQSRGGAALFQMRVSEHGGASPGIYVETLGGKEQLAFLSTEELWSCAPRPVLAVLQPWGETYGSIQKSEGGEYVLRRGKAAMWLFSGDFASHSVQVVTTGGEAVANVCPSSHEEYQVFVQARIDAGLLILGLLAIDKCEADPGSAQ
mmetsp:Transcript_11716/g.32002  ORF Transcript_11716/g.32002 Transcript_11716/m.32002 type:complete len:364 (-) Transcript_11716:26-1117(-)